MSKDLRRIERFIRRFKKWDNVKEVNEDDLKELSKRDINEILIAIKSIVKSRLFRLSDRYAMKMQVIGKILDTGIDAIFNLDFSDMDGSEGSDEAIDVELGNQYRVLLFLVKRMNKKIPERMEFVDEWFATHQRELEQLMLSFGIAVKTIQLTVNLIFTKK